MSTTRADREWVRAYGSEARVAWVRSLPSVVTGMRPCVNAHVRSGGTGRKADACWIVPLTGEEHAELHRIGQRSFAAKYRIDLETKAADIERLWQLQNDALPF
jgi:cell division inhibitor SulA